jgi:hypothetical protein
MLRPHFVERALLVHTHAHTPGGRRLLQHTARPTANTRVCSMRKHAHAGYPKTDDTHADANTQDASPACLQQQDGERSSTNGDRTSCKAAGAAPLCWCRGRCSGRCGSNCGCGGVVSTCSRLSLSCIGTWGSRELSCSLISCSHGLFGCGLVASSAWCLCKGLVTRGCGLCGGLVGTGGGDVTGQGLVGGTSGGLSSGLGCVGSCGLGSGLSSGLCRCTQ